MDKLQALHILTEMQLWRRGLPPYDQDTPEATKPMPYSPADFGQAIDVAIEGLKNKEQAKDNFCDWLKKKIKVDVKTECFGHGSYFDVMRLQIGYFVDCDGPLPTTPIEDLIEEFRKEM